MTYRSDSTVELPYGGVEQVRPHPGPGPALARLVQQYGETHSASLASQQGNTSSRPAVAWMVSNCLTPGNRWALAGHYSTINSKDVSVSSIQNITHIFSNGYSIITFAYLFHCYSGKDLWRR